ncbi:MAG TPA: hypothetical protein VGE21_12065 [Flavobacteriales bacterium]
MENVEERMGRKHPWNRPVLIPVFILVAIGVLGTAVMLLWNNIIPGVTGWSTITWWQALGLLVLCRILFGGFKGRSGPGGWDRWKQGPGGGPGLFGQSWSDRCRSMNDEQRQRLKDEWAKRCGGGFRGRGRGWSEPVLVPIRSEHVGKRIEASIRPVSTTARLKRQGSMSACSKMKSDPAGLRTCSLRRRRFAGKTVRS